uniref:60S ribosomal protein L12 n=1 Tax=Lygus hesperus TaxID=30085 RepID=A0A0A9YZG7_LYGHE
MSDIRAINSRYRTLPESALGVIYRYLSLLSDEVMTRTLQSFVQDSCHTTTTTRHSHMIVDKELLEFLNAYVCHQHNSSDEANEVVQGGQSSTKVDFDELVALLTQLRHRNLVRSEAAGSSKKPTNTTHSVEGMAHVNEEEAVGW